MLRNATLFSALILPCIPSTVAQSTNPAPAATPTILSQVANSFSGGRSLAGVHLTGGATWFSGGQEDSGTVALTATSDGAAQMDLLLDQRGHWAESQTAFGSAMSCTWTGNDGVEHTNDSIDCIRPTVWFLPAFPLASAN